MKKLQKLQKDQKLQDTNLPLIGWKEKISLPEFGLKAIKAKIDTGAKTSALHATDIQVMKRGSKIYVLFSVENDDGKKIHLDVPLIEERIIKSSTGEKTLRPVVETDIQLGTIKIRAQVTLINRDLMGFKMLIGRDAIKNHFLIHPNKAFLQKLS